MMAQFDPDQLLRDNMVLNSIDDILYDIGLSLTSVYNKPKPRKLLNKPIFILTLNSVFLLIRIAIACVSNENDQLLKILGDFTHMYGKLKQNFNLIFIFFTTFVLFSQWVYYLNHKRGIKLTFLKVFHMMSGSVTPREVGLTNEEDVRQLLRITRRVKKIIWFNNDCAIIVCAINFNLAGFYFKCGILDTLIYATPHAICIAVWVHIFSNIFGYQFMYFYIICKFLKIRLKRINESVIRMNSGKQFIRIGSLLPSLNSLYNEINENNTSYWSKFLLGLWLTLGTGIVALLRTVIFIELPTIISIVVMYAFLVYWSLFLFFIFTASSVNLEANKSLKYLHSLCVMNRYKKSTFSRRKYKVTIIVLFLRYICDNYENSFSNFSS